MNINYTLLKKAVWEEKIAHLLLFHGSGAEERHKAVLELTLMLNCKENTKTPCKACPACRKILSGNFPDIHFVQPAKTSIGIEQVLALQEKIYRKTYESKYRVCLIQEADKLTLAAANALLKIAEEPPANTIIILSASNVQGIISTLQSRAQSVYFSPPEEKEWAGDMEIFRLSGGDPDLARRVEEYGYSKAREWLKTYLDIICTQDIIKLFTLFPLEREESVLLLQLLALEGKRLVVQGMISPRFLQEIGYAQEMIRRQVNHRLALEVLAIKHIKLGGTKIG